MFDVFGIGNPMIDAIIKVNDSQIIDLNLKKGSMHLVDKKYSSKILEQFKNHEVLFVPGGDVVNTVTGIANLGGKAVFCGKVGLDKHGLLIEETMTNEGIKPVLIKSSAGTGSCISFVTPDNERTMITNLGAAITLREEEIIIEDVRNSKLLYVTGYILEDKNLRKMALKALNEAKRHKKIIAIDVSDPSLVERCKKDLKSVLKTYADIIFANKQEVLALTGKDGRVGLEEISKLSAITIVKLGEKGSLIKEKNNTYKLPGFKVKAVDTTGAGDMFAAGFLFGITNGFSVKKSGVIGNFVASRVVQKLGGRLDVSLKDKIKMLFKQY